MDPELLVQHIRLDTYTRFGRDTGGDFVSFPPRTDCRWGRGWGGVLQLPPEPIVEGGELMRLI